MNGMKILVSLISLLLFAADSFSQDTCHVAKPAKRPVEATTTTEMLIDTVSAIDACRMTVSIHRRYFCYTMQVEAWLGLAYRNDIQKKTCTIVFHLANGIVLNIKEPSHSQDITQTADQGEKPADGIYLRSRFLLSDFELEQLKTQPIASVTFIAPDGRRYKQSLPPDRQTLFIRLLQHLD